MLQVRGQRGILHDRDPHTCTSGAAAAEDSTSRSISYLLPPAAPPSLRLGSAASSGAAGASSTVPQSMPRPGRASVPAAARPCDEPAAMATPSLAMARPLAASSCRPAPLTLPTASCWPAARWAAALVLLPPPRPCREARHGGYGTAEGVQVLASLTCQQASATAYTLGRSNTWDCMP